MVSSLMFSLVLSLGTFWLIRHRWTETLFIAFPIYPTGSYQIYVVFSTFYVDFSIVLSIVLAIVPVYTALWWICNRHRGWKCFNTYHNKCFTLFHKNTCISQQQRCTTKVDISSHIYISQQKRNYHHHVFCWFWWANDEDTLARFYSFQC